MDKLNNYRQGKAPEILHNPQNINGENVLSGFALDLTDIFS